MASTSATNMGHANDVLICRMSRMHAAKHAFMRSNMTQDTENPQAVTPLVTATPKRENILLNWILMSVGMGAVGLVGKYLPDLFAMFR